MDLPGEHPEGGWSALGGPSGGPAHRIEPHVGPRDRLDALIGLAFLVAQLALFFGGPAVVAGIAMRHPVAGLVGFLLPLWVFSRFVVHRLEARADGLHFIRRAGSPKLIPWAEIKAVLPARRREVVLFGWIWPPFPAREMAPSLSSLGHYRIEYSGGYCFFPPRDEGIFLSTIRRYAPNALREGPA